MVCYIPLAIKIVYYQIYYLHMVGDIPLTKTVGYIPLTIDILHHHQILP